jgi:hypothetical protein
MKRMVSFRLGLGVYLDNFKRQLLVCICGEKRLLFKIEENEWIFRRQKCTNFAFYVMLNRNAQKVSITKV